MKRLTIFFLLLLSVGMVHAVNDTNTTEPVVVEPVDMFESVNVDGYTQKTVGTSYDAYFKPNSNWGDLMRYCDDTYCLVYQPQDMSYRDVNGAQDYISNIQSVSATVNLDNITYSESFPNTDIVYTPSGNGLKEDFVLKSQPRVPASYLGSNVSLDFGGYIKFPGLDMYVDDVKKTSDFVTNKQIDFRDSSGKTVFYLPEPVAVDANGVEQVLSYEVDYRSNQIWFYVKTPYSFLQTASYPVKIDPSVLDNAQLYYAFDTGSGTTAVDSSGNGNDGTLDSSILWTTDGKIGNAVAGDGTNNITTSFSINGYTSFTANIWVKATDISTFQVIAGQQDPSIVWRFDVFSNEWGMDFGGNRFTTAATTGTYTMLTITWDGSTARFYKDGSQFNTASVSSFTTPTSDMTVLNRNDGSNSPYTGKADELSIYSRELNSSEISDLYNSGNGFNPYSIFSVTAQDADTNISIDDFSVLLNGTIYNTTNGTIITDILANSTSLWNVTVFSDGYRNITYSDYNVSTNLIANLTANIAPNITTPIISPSSPTVLDDINASSTYTDNESDIGNVYWFWYVNGSNVYNDSTTSVSSGSTATSTLDSSLTSTGDPVYVVAYATDVYGNSSANFTSSTVNISGIPPPPVENLTSPSQTKESIYITWDNPTNVSWNYTEVWIDSDNVINTTNEEYNFTGLQPTRNYTIELYTVSDDGTRNNTAVSITQQTVFNPLANITRIFPPDATYTLQENETYNFTINASDDDGGNLVVEWFRNGVSQLIETITSGSTSAWQWITGFTDEGIYNVTVVVNDTYNDSSTLEWEILVEDTFPEPIKPLEITPDGGSHEYQIPLLCRIDYSPVPEYHFEWVYSINGSNYTEMNKNKTEPTMNFDITTDAYGTNYSFGCRVVSVSGTSNYTYTENKATKTDLNHFYVFIPETNQQPTGRIPYTTGFVAEMNNNINASIASAFADCTGNGVWDYTWDYREQDITETRETFQCVNIAGTVEKSVGVVLYKNNSLSWDAIGCKGLRSSDNYCAIYKSYEVRVR